MKNSGNPPDLQRAILRFIRFATLIGRLSIVFPFREGSPPLSLSLAAGKLPRYYKCRGFFDERRMRANIPSRSNGKIGRSAIADAMREYAWAAAREDATKVRFAAESEIQRFEREFCVPAVRFGLRYFRNALARPRNVYYKILLLPRQTVPAFT